MKPVDLSLYLVTERRGLALEKFFQIILQAVEGGVKIVQLREKETAAQEIVEIGKALHLLLKPLNIPLIINDSPQIALKVGAEGVHLGQSDLNVAEARKMLGKHAIIGLSIESLEQAENAIGEAVDYLAVSPIFPTNTKSNCATHLGLEGLRTICSLSNCPVIAIGGIDATNAASVFEAGAAGVAVVSAIFKAPDPKAAAAKILSQRPLHG
jgi:thiamine-phosphate pyrophosphorylase